MSNSQKVKVGVALFDDVKNPNTGVCSLAGGEAELFRTPGDLESDCIWITNLDYNQAFNARLRNNQKLRWSNFFRIEIERIAVELSLDLVGARNRAVVFLSQIAHRTINISKEIYGFDRVKDTLRKTIEDVILDPTETVEQPFIADALDQSFKAYQHCYGPKKPGNVEYYLRFPRATYARQIAKLPIPKGVWKRITEKLPLVNRGVRTGKESATYLFLENIIDRRPALLKVSVTEVDPRFAHLLDYGQGSELREWVPIPEVMQMAAYSNVTILDMLVAESVTQPDPRLSSYIENMDISQEASYSYGLICESHTHAIFSKRKLSIKGEQKLVTSARASWLRAWDRVICFAVAAEIEKLGFRVMSYGIGNIQVSAGEHEIKRLLDVVKKFKLTPPLRLIEDVERASEYSDLLEQKHLSQGV